MAPSRRPNILFIFTDQQRADTIGALGNPIIRTPAMDRLVREGTSFTRAYSPAPECVPARCSLLYGQDPVHTFCGHNGDRFPDGRTSYAALLTRAGYRTHAIGKCHFTPDPLALLGFESRQTQEEMTGQPESDDYLRFLHANGFAHVTDPHGVRGEMYYIPQPAQMPARLHPTQWVGDRAVEFIGAQTSDRPWMLYAGIIHPHPPFCPPAPWHKLYRTGNMPLPWLPEGYESLQAYINRYQNRYKYRDRGLDLQLIRTIRAYYYGCVSFIDMQVGRMIDALERTGQLDNTLIVLSSDHGEMLGDYGSFGKRSMHDAAARVPLLARLPGRFRAGARCAAPASLVDLMPTFLGAGRVDGPAGLDGVDLAGLASGQCPRDRVYVQYRNAGHGLYSVVTADAKLTWSAPDQREFFFDHRVDPAESFNGLDRHHDRALADDLRRSLQTRLSSTPFADAVENGQWKKWPVLNVPSNPDAGLLIQDHPWADQRIPGYSEPRP